MKNVMKTALFCASALIAANSANAAVLDDFNRANAGTLGSAWTQQAGASSIAGNQATGTDGSLATFNGGNGNTVSFDIANVGSSTQYIAAILGYGAGSANYFVKVQNNGGTQGFNTFGFYVGNNGGGLFGNLLTAFTSGSVSVSYTGTLATLTINPTGGTQQVYTHDYGVGPDGTGIGLGFYGAALADNFGNGLAVSAVPESATWMMMIAGFAMAGASLRYRRRKIAVSFG